MLLRPFRHEYVGRFGAVAETGLKACYHRPQVAVGIDDLVELRLARLEPCSFDENGDFRSGDIQSIVHGPRSSAVAGVSRDTARFATTVPRRGRRDDDSISPSAKGVFVPARNIGGLSVGESALTCQFCMQCCVRCRSRIDKSPSRISNILKF